MTTEMQQFWETRDRLMRTGSVERMETFLTQWQQKMETKGNFLDWASVPNEKGLFYRKIGLLDKLNVTDRNKLEKVVVALTQINTLRNRLAHEVLFIVDNSDFSYWAIEVLANFNGAKFTKYTYRTKIIHAFSVLSKNILELDQSVKQ